MVPEEALGADLGKHYRGDFRAAPNVRVMLHSTVTALETNAAGTVLERAEFRSLCGKRGVVSARVFVLCCGGIENARLLRSPLALISVRAFRNSFVIALKRSRQ